MNFDNLIDIKTIFWQHVYSFAMQDALKQLKAEGHSIYVLEQYCS